MRKELVAAGFGGQGIVLLGILATIASGIFDNKQVAQSQSYGPSARGGACRTDLIISDETIDYGKSIKPDVIVFMSEPAKEKYLKELGDEDTLIIIDSTLVKDLPDMYKNVYKIPATDMAEKKLGNIAVANTLILGALTAITDLISFEGLQYAIKKRMQDNPKMVDLNLKAIQVGYEYGKKLI
jgi:2-oxoglutarate ferredoxin oxidoreductase subunit gamma